MNLAPKAPSRTLIRKVLELRKKNKEFEAFKDMQIKSHRNLKALLQERTKRFEQFYNDSIGKDYLG